MEAINFQNHHQYQLKYILFTIILLVYIFTPMNVVPKCNKNFTAIHVCVNGSCKIGNPFICDQNDECQSLHKNCSIKRWSNYMSELCVQMYTKNCTFIDVCSKIQQMIKKIIEQLQLELKNFNNWKNEFGGVSKIIDFFKSIKHSQENQWRGKDINKLQYYTQTKIDKHHFDSKEINQQIKRINDKISNTINQIKNVYLHNSQFNKFIKLKQLYVSQINESLKNIQVKPENLQIKFVIIQLFSVLNFLLNRHNFHYLGQTQIQQSKFYPTYLGVKQINNETVIQSISQTVDYQYLYRKQNDSKQEQLIQQQRKYTTLCYKVDELCELLRSDKFKNIKILTIYFSNCALVKHMLFLNFCQCLMTLPKLQQFTIIVQKIVSTKSFENLGKRFKAKIQKNWWNYDW